MNAIRIVTVLESDTPHLPELGPLVGRRVEIVITEVPPGVDWAGAAEAARRLREMGYDLDVVERYREFDREHAEDHLS